jgi:hypothetical protein
MISLRTFVVKKYLKSNNAFLKAITFLILGFGLSIKVNAQTSPIQNTVSNYKYLEGQIAKISEGTALSFDNLRTLFSKTPEYKTFCFSDIENPVSNSAESKKLFAQFLPAELEGSVQFDFEPLALGFNIFQKNDMQWIDGSSTSQVLCAAGTSSCTTLNMSLDSSFTHLPENKDYADEVTKSETWTTYIDDLSRMYLELRISLAVKSLDWMGRESTAVTYQQSYLCVADLESYQTEL